LGESVDNGKEKTTTGKPGLRPAGKRRAMTWREFVRSYFNRHSGLSRASSRHSGGKGLLTGSDLIPTDFHAFPVS
jgi:hypothetical protein